MDSINDEAEFEEGGWEEEAQQTSPPKRPGSTIAPPEAKKPAQPESMASHRNPKQEVIPSEAQMKGRTGGIGDDLEDHQLKQALARSVLDIQHDPSETPNTGGSAASSIPSEPVVAQPQEQSGTPPLMTKEELARAQELFRLVSDELADLQYRMRSDVNFTQEDMDRMNYLQPIAI